MPKINQLTPTKFLDDTDIMIADTEASSNTRKISYSDFKDQLKTDIAKALVEITWAELKTLRDEGKLIPGMQYKITDYICTVANDENARVESHPYDIIVTADSESVLNENARAALKDGDTYYHVEGQTDANLKAWELKYCLDNDTSRFAWADEANGKGVVYFLRDDRGNECWYDFKQIQFKRFKITAFDKVSSLVGKYTTQPADGITVDEENPEWHFTFYGISESGEVIDNSVIPIGKNRVYSNIINYYSINPKKGFVGVLMLCNNTFGMGCFNNTFGNACRNNTFGDGCFNNTFVNECCNNTFDNGCFNNTFGDGCCNNTFVDGCSNNTFGNACRNNTFWDVCYYNTFVNECCNNTFGNGCSNNTFGTNCSDNTFVNECCNNTFGNGCFNNTFGDGCCNNTFGNVCEHITVYDSVIYYNVMSGVGGTESAPLVLVTTPNNKYTTYVGYNSAGDLKYLNPMDRK